MSDSGVTLPTLDELLDSVRVVAIPTRTRFRGISVREAAVFVGPQGATEFSPFLEYGPAEAASWLAAAIDFGWRPVPPLKRGRIAVNATVPAVSAVEVPAVLARFPGCTAAKVKVAEPGQHLADDIARVAAVREVLGPTGVIRVDANGGWAVAAAIHAVTALSAFDLDYAEQPCRTVPELTALRTHLHDAGVPVRIAADESVRRADDPLAVARAGAADLLVVKAQPLGGIHRALDIVTTAGLPVVVSSALDTSIGISMGLHLAAALPEHLLAGACGLGTVALLAGDVTRPSLTPVAGEIPVVRPTLDPELLDSFAANPTRTAAWEERIRATYGHLTRPQPVQGRLQCTAEPQEPHVSLEPREGRAAQ